MSNQENNKDQNSCSNLNEDSINKWAKSAQPTVDGKYQCRYCGLIFNTLEEHDAHHRQVHGEYSEYLTTNIQS